MIVEIARVTGTQIVAIVCSSVARLLFTDDPKCAQRPILRDASTYRDPCELGISMKARVT